MSDGRAIDADRDPDLQALLVACALCNDSFLQEEQGQWKIVGDPTEGALVTLAAKAGIQKDQWSSRLPRVAEFPFSSERKRMSVICRTRQEAGGRSQEVQDYALSSLASHNSAYLM